MTKPKARVQNGDTLLVDKSKIPAKYLEVSKKDAEKIVAQEARPREKKPLSEKQQANLQRLIELNKKRREEKLAQMRVNVDELGEIPEDKVVVKAVTQMGRPRKEPVPKNPVGRPRKNQPKSDDEHEVVPAKPVLQREKKQVARRPLSPPPSETEPYGSSASEEEPEEKAPAKKPRNPSGRAPAKKIEKAGKIVNKQRTVVRKPRYVSETSETEAAADDEDSDDSDYEPFGSSARREEEKVKKYVAKTKARMEALKQIETQLKPASKYAGMSIF